MRADLLRHSRPRGFSLLEVVLALVLLGILVVFGSNMISESVTVSKRANQESAALAQTRIAVERLLREIREISWNRTAGAYEISTLTANRLVFIRRVGSLATTVTIDYSPTNQQLTLLTSGVGVTSPQVLLSDVSSFQFIYRDGSRVVTTNLGQLRLIEISLTQGLTIPPVVMRTHVGLRHPE